MGIAAGTLNRRITIEKRGPDRDSLGQPLVNAPWVPVATVAANIAAKSGLQTAAAGGEVSVARYSIRIRYRPAVNDAMRVVYQGEVYDIQAVLHDEAGRQHTDLVCEIGARAHG